jgi:hypothetical protein
MSVDGLQTLDGHTCGSIDCANRICFPQMQNARQVTASVSGRAEREGLKQPSPTARRKARKFHALQQVPLVAVYGQNIQKSDKTFKKIRQAEWS